MKSTLFLAFLIAWGVSPNASAFNTYVNTSAGNAVKGFFNSDAYDDLAIVVPGSNILEITLSTGRGTFGSPTNIATGAGTVPMAVAVGDIDQDGDDDLIVVNAGTKKIAYYKNSGSGAFSLSASFATGIAPTAAVVADFNTDGYPDVAVVNDTSATVGIYLNSSTTPGSFAAAVNYGVGTGNGTVRSINVADFNADGYKDLVVTNPAAATVGVLLNVAAIPGTFGSQTTYAVGTLTTTTGGVAVGDLNNDGYADIANLNSAESRVSILLNSGTGTFGAASNFTVDDAGSIGGLAMADFNEDNNLDIVATNPGKKSVSVITGNGNGTFNTKTDYTVINTPKSIIISDKNGDGHWDLYVVNYVAQQTSLIGTGAGTF